MMMRAARHALIPLLLALLAFCYITALEADSIGGMFGVLWNDEGAYLLPAKHDALFGTAHPFANDQYKPEYTAPLLHLVGRAVLSPENTVWGIRFTVAVLVLLGHGIIARLAACYHQRRSAGYGAFALLFLCPMSFFYARVGLSEGLQYFFVACALWSLWELYHAQSTRRSLGFTLLTAALIAVILLAKITSVSIVAGLGIGLLAVVWARPLPQRMTHLAAGLLAGAASLGVLWLWWIGGNSDLWWSNNIVNDVTAAYRSEHIGNLGIRFGIHVFGLNHFLVLMPIFILGFTSFFIAAERARGYLGVLWLVAAVSIAIDFFFGAELRRNYFGLSMLMVLAAFVVPEWLRDGANWRGKWSIRRVVAALIVAAFVGGSLLFVYRSFLFDDPVFRIASPIYALCFLVALFASGTKYRTARYVVVGYIVAWSVVPIVIQVAFPSYTIRNAVRAIESEVAADQSISGVSLVWDMIGIKRQILFTQCSADIPIGNMQEAIPATNRHILIYPLYAEKKHCVPADFDRYEQVQHFRIFKPYNKGPGWGGSRNWLWHSDIALYRKAAP